jgi:hypothetical protein
MTDTSTTPDPGDTIEISWNDETWTVPAKADDWPFQATEALELGRGVTFLRHVLGREQMRRFAAGTRTKTSDAAELMGHVIDAVGAKSAGESPAS